MDGFPRISPVEPEFVDGELMLGMMWRSRKALDVPERERRAAYVAALKARIEWEPPGPFHLLAIDVESAGFVVFDEERYGLAWDPAGGLRRWAQRES